MQKRNTLGLSTIDVGMLEVHYVQTSGAGCAQALIGEHLHGRQPGQTRGLFGLAKKLMA